MATYELIFVLFSLITVREFRNEFRFRLECRTRFSKRTSVKHKTFDILSVMN